MHGLTRGAMKFKATSHDAKRFYDGLKAPYGPQPFGSASLISADKLQLPTTKKQNLGQMG